MLLTSPHFAGNFCVREPMHVQGVEMADVLKVLRKRFGTSGITEKASRSKH